MIRAERLVHALLETGGSKGRLAAFGGNLPPTGLYADGEDELLTQMQQGGYVQGQPDQARSQLYGKHSVLHAKNPKEVSVYGQPRLNLDKKTGDAALASLGVDPETKEVQAVPHGKANRVSMPLKKAVYADKDHEDVQAAAEENGERLPVYIGLNGGLTVPGSRGVLVGAVVPGSPLAQAGLRPGDVIAELGGARVRTQEVLRALASGLQPGKPYTLRVRRGTQEYRTTIIPAEPALR